MPLTFTQSTTYDTWCEACACACQNRAEIQLQAESRSALAVACTGDGTFIYFFRNGELTGETCPGAHTGDFAAAVRAEVALLPWVSGPAESISTLTEGESAFFSQARFRLCLAVPLETAPPVAATIYGGWRNRRGDPFAGEEEELPVIASGPALLSWDEDGGSHRYFRSEWMEVLDAGDGEWSYVELTTPLGVCLDPYGAG